MKRMALVLAAGTAIAGPAALLAQVAPNAAPSVATSNEPFPWPDFIEPDPLPGGYLMTFSMEDMTIEGLGDGKAEQEMAEMMQGGDNEIERQYFCVAGDIERFDMLEEMRSGPGECTTRPVRIDGDAFSTAVSCQQPDGSQMQVQMTGTATDSSLDALMAMRMKEQSMGRMSMTFRISLERIGECSDLPDGEPTAPAGPQTIGVAPD